MDRAGRCPGRRRRRLARVLQRSAARRAREGGARLQPRSPRRGGARRAGGGIPEGRGRVALPAGEPARPRRRQDERRRERAGGRRRVRELGARPLGARALGRGRGGVPVRLRRARLPLRPPVDRRAGRERLVPRHRGAHAEGARRRDGARVGAPRRPRAGSPPGRRRRRVRRAPRAGEPADLPRRRAEPRPRVPAGAAVARDARGPLPRGGGRGASRARARARAGAGRDALRSPRAPPGRRRRRAARRRGVLPHRGSESGAAAAHLADRRGDQHFERALRPQGTGQPDMERRRRR